MFKVVTKVLLIALVILAYVVWRGFVLEDFCFEEAGKVVPGPGVNIKACLDKQNIFWGYNSDWK